MIFGAQLVRNPVTKVVSGTPKFVPPKKNIQDLFTCKNILPIFALKKYFTPLFIGILTYLFSAGVEHTIVI